MGLKISETTIYEEEEYDDDDVVGVIILGHLTFIWWEPGDSSVKSCVLISVMRAERCWWNAFTQSQWRFCKMIASPIKVHWHIFKPLLSWNPQKL